MTSWVFLKIYPEEIITQDWPRFDLRVSHYHGLPAQPLKYDKLKQVSLQGSISQTLGLEGNGHLRGLGFSLSILEGKGAYPGLDPL